MPVSTSTAVNVSVVSKAPKTDAVVEFANEQGGSPAVEALRGAKLFAGKPNELALTVADDATLAVVGLGDGSVKHVRSGSALAARRLRKQGVASVLLRLEETDEAQVEAAVAGFVIGCFNFTDYRGTAAKPDNGAKKLKIAIATRHKAAVKRGEAIGLAQNFARNVASTPGNDLYPDSLAKIARKLANQHKGLTCKVMDEKKLAEMKMGGILAVGQGSARKPRMIVLEHKGGKKNEKPLLVVGKSITFDTGGISIKPAANMGAMIYDKCGGMAVLGLMHAVAALGVKRNVVGILSAAENMPGDNAYRPGDIITMYNGITVEVTNTDAEGRLVLGDAIAWGCKTYKPSGCVDLATLTGGCVVALGEQRAGSWSNDDDFAADVQSAADATDEPVWRMPLGEDFAEQLRGSVSADVVNSPGRWGSACTAAQFLQHFVPDGTPWVHLDIAGPAETPRDLPLYPKGPTGFGVRTLVKLAENG
ncbi:MAG: leucyl aminopeptidase [Planctomycetota bacterium]